ncbi:hypothetical protein HGRIS_000818 [Hohenbuehelia grisea]|uniref:Uncharacterized protein n=1 Tax=Hohenbuehelia grisea TaxID=104357 RepID=A0ABR3IPU6_9AGAR
MSLHSPARPRTPPSPRSLGATSLTSGGHREKGRPHIYKCAPLLLKSIAALFLLVVTFASASPVLEARQKGQVSFYTEPNFKMIQSWGSPGSCQNFDKKDNQFMNDQMSSFKIHWGECTFLKDFDCQRGIEVLSLTWKGESTNLKIIGGSGWDNVISSYQCI